LVTILDAAGAIVGAEYHERKGQSHAEVHALAAAGERARGGTAVVTLEPCNHAGRTPACRQALLDAGVARVVIALIDPTSRGEGGAAVLRAAGVDVEVGVLAQEAWLVLGDSLTTLSTGRPVVTLVRRLDGSSVSEADVRSCGSASMRSCIRMARWRRPQPTVTGVTSSTYLLSRCSAIPPTR
jgi:diaminohydroxyphosphoribosylaminopyrimidine deaminase/5-amino-6-(5-phosphoribosylamino)uracil reductase